MNSNIRIVMINTFHPGNIGAAARAMKNMGLESLYLVDPQDYPSADAVSRAAGAKDVLDRSVIVDTLEEAIQDCSLVIGTSARMRSDPWPVITPDTCAQKLVEESQAGPVAVVFGRETMGMLNEELQLCNFHVCIPANPDYPVLNVSSAIQLIVYEIFKHSQSFQQQKQQIEREPKYVELREMTLFVESLEKVLKALGFLIEKHPGRTMLRIKRLVNRVRPEAKEMNILWGMMSSAQNMIDRLQHLENQASKEGQEKTEKDMDSSSSNKHL